MQERYELVTPGRASRLGIVRTFMRDLVDQYPGLAFDEPELLEMELVLQEACVNSIRHGHSGRTDLPLKLVFLAEPGALTIEIHDHGPGFEIDGIPAPKSEDLQEGGYGVYIMKSTMDLVEGRRGENGFVLRLRKFCAVPSGTAAAESR